MVRRALLVSIFLCVAFFSALLPRPSYSQEDDIGFWSLAPQWQRALHFAYERREPQQFSVTIRQVDIARFPIISVYTSVEDSNGYNIADIPPELFRLTENYQNLPFELDRVVGEEGGVKVALVLDTSGSMSGEKLFAAKNAAMAFVHNIRPLDRFALVAYDYDAYVVEEFTSSEEELVDAIGDLYSGGLTAMYDGIYLALDLTRNERGVRAIIAFTDGLENNSSHSKQEVLDYASQTGIPVFTIGFGNDADEAELRSIANETGGRYGFALTGEELADLYLQLVKLVKSEYLLLYRSPNDQYDRTPRVVEVCVNYWGQENCGYSSYRATEPPKIVLTDATKQMSQPGYSHPDSTPITIEAIITDDEAVLSAKLFWRPSGPEENPYQESVMTPDEWNHYSSTIPADAVQFPGIDYFICASDEFVTVSEPSYMPETYPLQIAVQPNLAPQIDHTPKTVGVVGADIILTMAVSDRTDYVQSVSVFARKVGASLYEEIGARASVEDGMFSARIPGRLISEEGMEYYIVATDNHNLSAHHGSHDEPHYVAPLLMSVFPIYVYAKQKDGTELPLQDADVFVNGELVGRTDRDGLITVEHLAVDDEILAIKRDAGRVFATKADHQWVDNTLFVLNLHNAVWTKARRYRAFIVKDLAPNTPDHRQNICLNRATIGINLLVSIQFDATADYIDNVAQGLQAVSDLILDATNGQFKLGEVAILDNARCWEKADIRIYASCDTRPHSSIGGAWQASTVWDAPTCALPWAFVRKDTPLGCNDLNRCFTAPLSSETLFCDPSMITALAHLLGHYIFSLYDENIRGDRSPYQPKTPALAPRNFGVMDTALLAREFSSWNEYLGRYDVSPPLAEDAPEVTMQLFKTGLPCWQQIEAQFEQMVWSPTDYEVKIAVPRTVYYAENVEDTELEGPFDGGQLEAVHRFDEQEGAFDLTARVTFDNRPVPDSLVFVENGKLRIAGRTDSLGRIRICGAIEGDRITCYATLKEWLHFPYPYCVGEVVVQPGQTEYQVECRRPTPPAMPGQDDTPPRLAISGDVEMTGEHASLQLLILTEELIPYDPVVIVEGTNQPGERPADMLRATEYSFIGSVDIGVNPAGALRVRARDFDGNAAVSRGIFSIHPVKKGSYNEVVALDGGLSILIDEGEVGSDQALLVIASELLPPNPPTDAVLISKVYSLSLEKDRLNLESDSNARLIFHLGQRYCNGSDFRSFAIYRFEAASRRWLPVSGLLDVSGEYASTRTSQLGTFAVFGQPCSDSQKPNPPLKLTGHPGQCKSQVLLSWEAPSDDSATEPVARYVIRYSDKPIRTQQEWQNATLLSAPDPLLPGQPHYALFDMPQPHTEYYFAAASVDEAGNVSDLATTSGHSPAAETVFYDAIAQDGQVTLIWETASEQGSAGWRVYQRRFDEDQFHSITATMIPPVPFDLDRRRYVFVARGLVNTKTYYFIIENVAADQTTARSHEIPATPNKANISHPPYLWVTTNKTVLIPGDRLQITAAVENRDLSLLASVDVTLQRPDRRIITLFPSFPFLLQPYQFVKQVVHASAVDDKTLKGTYIVRARIKAAARGILLKTAQASFQVN